MAAACHDEGFRKKTGIPKKTACEFNAHDKKLSKQMLKKNGT